MDWVGLDWSRRKKKKIKEEVLMDWISEKGGKQLDANQEII